MKTGKCVVTGPLTFFTCKTGRGRDRFCVKVTGEVVIDGEKRQATVQCFEDWDMALPKRLECVLANLCTDPMTGLKRSIKGTLKGTVEVPEGIAVVERPGDTVTFLQVDLPLDAFDAEPTGIEIVKLQA